MTWFETLTGFSETPTDQVRERLRVEGNKLTSLANRATYTIGTLEIPSLAQLRQQVQDLPHSQAHLSVREVIGDVKALHADTANADSLFQVASQFNMLEMTGPDITPEQGVGRYEHDHTQGPFCAIACGAGTLYRNYLVPLQDQIGQSASRQIDCLADIGAALGNDGNKLWRMQNGYMLATRSGLQEISRRLQAMTEADRDQLRGLLRIGLQWNTQVTLQGCTHTVSQAYCSALPISYNDLEDDLWSAFAPLILEASYEAVMCAAVLNAARNKNNTVFLTSIGGGAFGNPREWITDAMERSLDLFHGHDLDVAIVGYTRSSEDARRLVNRFP
jgi:hypothetical protein